MLRYPKRPRPLWGQGWRKGGATIPVDEGFLEIDMMMGADAPIPPVGMNGRRPEGRPAAASIASVPNPTPPIMPRL